MWPFDSIDDEAILNDTLKSRSLLPALDMALQLEASKWQALSVKANAKANAMTTSNVTVIHIGSLQYTLPSVVTAVFSAGS